MTFDPRYPEPPAIPGQTMVQPVRTPLTVIEAATALSAAYRHVFRDELSRRALCCLLAHTALETGQWRSIWCSNWGNVKASDHYRGRVYFVRCNEIIEGRLEWFDPYHGQTRFRAYDTAAAGAEQYVRFVGTATRGSGKPNRYQAAWDAAMLGDVVGFVDELARAHYFTANPSRYLAGVRALFHQFLAGLPAMLPDVQHQHDPVVLQPTNGHSRTSDEDLRELVAALQVPLVWDFDEHVADRDAEVRRKTDVE